MHMYVCMYIHVSTAKGASRSRGNLQSDGKLQQRGEGECFKTSFVESKFDLIVLCWWANCFMLLTWLPSLHSLCICFHIQCAQYVREYFPMMFELLKQGVVSGVHVCDYASVTMYQNGCVLCLLYPLNYTCMEFCSVLSWGVIAVIFLWISHRDDDRWQLSLGVVLLLFAQMLLSLSSARRWVIHCCSSVGGSRVPFATIACLIWVLSHLCSNKHF